MSARGFVVEKRSSRSSTKRSKSSLTKKLSSITESFNEDSEIIVRGIVQDIVESASEKIHERYMERQTIRFVVHCAHQALMKVLRIHFYQHNDYIRTHEFWGSEKRVDPSYPDSWAINQVPISKNISEEQEFNTLSRIKLEMQSKGAEITVDSTVDLASVPSEALLEDIRAIIDEIIDNLPIRSEETPEQIETTESAFTLVVEGLQHYSDFKMKPQLSRISTDATQIRLPRIDLPESGNSRRQQSVSELSTASVQADILPPIRTDATYKCLTNIVPEEKIKKSKSKEKKKEVDSTTTAD